MHARRKSSQSEERDTVCVKHKNIFDTNFKTLVLEDSFYLDEGTKVDFALKKDIFFMWHSGSIPNACNGDLSQHNTQLMIHANEIFYHFEAVVLNNSWKNIKIIESFHKDCSQGSGV